MSFFISQRIRAKGGNNFSATITRIAIGSIAVGLAVMIVSFIIFKGFREAIQDKIFNQWSHVQVTRYDLNNSYDGLPVSLNSAIYQHPEQFPGVSHVQAFSMKAGLLKTDKEIMGVVLKGVGAEYDTARFTKDLIQGRMPELGGEKYSTEVVISKKIANTLELAVNDDVLIYFIQEPPRIRKLQITGIYETGLEEFDQRIILGDNQLVQRLNNWADSLSGGLEVFVDDIEQLDKIEEEIYAAIDADLFSEKVTDRFMHYFDWFTLLKSEIIGFLAITDFIAFFNIVSIILIMIMERTRMIGTLKALGATNKQIRMIFLYNGLRLLAWGLAIGNLLGIGFGLLQQHYKLIPLDQENYFMDTVPISFDWATIVVLNVLVIVLVSLVLVVPTFVIARIDPIKSIKFD